MSFSSWWTSCLWYSRPLHPTPSSFHLVRHFLCFTTMVQFCYQFAIFEFSALIGLSWFRHAHNEYETDTSKNIAPFYRIFYCFAWFNTVEFIRMPCPNDMRYNNVVFADQFRYQFAMFGFRSFYCYLYSFMHIKHMKQILPKSSRNSAEYHIVLHDLILLNSVVCRVKTTRCTMM